VWNWWGAPGGQGRPVIRDDNDDDDNNKNNKSNNTQLVRNLLHLLRTFAAGSRFLTTCTHIQHCTPLGYIALPVL
jgi:hypothetical protein